MESNNRKEQQRILEEWRKENPPIGEIVVGGSQLEGHLLALEGSLLSFQSHLEKMPSVEKVIRKMRKKTRRKVRGKFTSESKKVAAEGLTSRRRYWHEYYGQLDASYTRLESQLELTEIDYPQLVESAREQLIAILQDCKKQKAPSHNHKAHAIMESWNVFINKLEAAIEENGHLLPNIRNELHVMHNRIQIAMQAY